MSRTTLDALYALHEDMTEWRRDLHAHPELGYEETRTSDVIAERLESFGVAVSRGWAGTGIVGTLSAGSAERAIGLRADIDALPMTERNTFAHRSRHEGCMHACGHDGHTAMLLGAARHLAESRDFDGRVHFIFQPAEEGLGGGDRMVRQGLFEHYPVAGVYGMHNWPGLDSGVFHVLEGPVMASSDFFELTVTGQGGHAAMPQLGIDPFTAVGQLLPALQSLPSRRVAATDALVISVTQIEGGSAYNVIPDRVILRGTVRALREPVRQAARRDMQQLAYGIGQATGTQITLDYHDGYPVTVNHTAEAGHAARAATAVANGRAPDNDRAPSMGAEDFAYMLNACPGAYVWLGNGGDSAALHSTQYDFNDEILPVGAAYWATLARQRLAGD